MRFEVNRFRAFWLVFVALCFSLQSVSALAGNGDISLSGRNILRDGKPWVPKGFVLVAFVASKEHAKDSFAKARARYGTQLLDKVKGFGADVVRIHASQAALDPKSPIYSPGYLEDYKKGIALARAKGLTVIVSMQWEETTGLKGQSNMPSDMTRRAWERLAPVFANDLGVMYELFNEPGLKEQNARNWQIWKEGHQSLIDLVRRTGAKNVLIVEGLRIGHYLSNAPSLKDPMNKLVYGVHPFINKETRTRADWDRDWGRFADSHPVIVTAFNAHSSRGNCKPDTPKIVSNLLDYLSEKRIGVIFWAFDLPGPIFEDGGLDRLTNFENFSCAAPNKGVGVAAQRHFRGAH
ncbi:glycoside hydrolase family 5 protein [Methylolobus aquaticus]